MLLCGIGTGLMVVSLLTIVAGMFILLPGYRWSYIAFSICIIIGLIMAIAAVVFIIVGVTDCRCPNCSEKVSVSDDFCRNCGQSLVPQSITCPSCNEIAGQNDIFCHKCGHKIVE